MTRSENYLKEEIIFASQAESNRLEDQNSEIRRGVILPAR